MSIDEAVKLIDAVKWPIMVFAAVVVVLLISKRQCADFIARLRSVGKDGLKAGPTTEQPNQETDKLKQVQQLLQVFDSPVILEREQNIKTELKKRGLQHEGETIDVLVVPWKRRPRCSRLIAA